MDRAYSVLDIKSVDSEQRIIEGIASTPDVDRQGHSMDPAGAEYTLPMPFLWFHDDRNPIGEVFSVTPRPDGIYIKARVSKVTKPSRLKTLVDDAWAAFTASPPLVRGLSIGYKALDGAPMAGTKALRITKWLWGELSAVTVPANVQATILTVKSFDRVAPAAFGLPQPTASLPGVSGLLRKQAGMNISEQVTEQQTLLQTKSARLEELETQDGQEGGLEETAQQERATLTSEVDLLVKKVARLKTIEAAQLQIAGPLPAAAVAPLHKSQVGPRVEIPPKPQLPKGTLFTRYAMAIAAGRGSLSDTMLYAKRWDRQTPEVSAFIRQTWGLKPWEQKAIEGTSVVGSPAWGGELVNPSTILTEFVELLRAETIIGRVEGFRRTPFNVPILTQTGGSTFDWVGEGGVKPVGELAFTRTTLPYHKIAGIIVMTEELVRLSQPNAEETARRDLIEAAARFIDEQFIRAAVAAGSDNPASITNGVASPAASGTTLAALLADLNTAIQTLVTANIPPTGLVWVTTPEVALRLSLMTTDQGNTPSGFNVNPSGGTLLGYPVIVSNSVDADNLVLFKPSEIFLADDGQVTLDASREATLDMTGGATPVFSLWQRNCVGIRAERWITWKKRRTTVVAIIDTIAYVPGT